MNPTKSLIVAIKDFFGMQPGNGLMDFKKEVAQLTPKDRMELADGLRKNGYPDIECQAGE